MLEVKVDNWTLYINFIASKRGMLLREAGAGSEELGFLGEDLRKS
jgi:hypothetical protein